MWRKLSIVNNVCRETGCFREKSLTRCLSKVFHFVRLRKHFACSVYEGSAHNLGVFLDKQLSVSHHIANLRRNTHKKKNRPISIQVLVQSLVVSWPDYRWSSDFAKDPSRTWCSPTSRSLQWLHQAVASELKHWCVPTKLKTDLLTWRHFAHPALLLVSRLDWTLRVSLHERPASKPRRWNELRLAVRVTDNLPTSSPSTWLHEFTKYISE